MDRMNIRTNLLIAGGIVFAAFTAIVITWVAVSDTIGGGHVIGGLGVAFAAIVTAGILIGALILGAVIFWVRWIVRSVRRHRKKNDSGL